MNPDITKLLEEAPRLPSGARGALATRLLDSLDPGMDDSCEQEWDQEIRRRVEELDNGAVRTIPWNEIRRPLTDS